MYDGRPYELPPHKDVMLDAYVARHLRNQSVFRDNPITGAKEYRLAVLEDGDPTEPLEDLPLESLDRSDMDMPKSEIRPTGIGRMVPHLRGPVERFGSLPTG